MTEARDEVHVLITHEAFNNRHLLLASNSVTDSLLGPSQETTAFLAAFLENNTDFNFRIRPQSLGKKPVEYESLDTGRLRAAPDSLRVGEKAFNRTSRFLLQLDFMVVAGRFA